MTLGAYEPPVRVQGDKFAAQDNQNKPLIVVARQFIENAKTKHSPEGKPGIRIDVVDLLDNGRIYIDALWMSGALVDGLKPHVAAGTPLPVEIQQVTSGSGNPYLTLVPLLDDKRKLAEGWYAKNPTAVADERAKREAEAKPLGTMEAPAEQNGATPAPAVAEAGPAESAPAPATEPKQESMNEDAVAAALARLNG